MQSSKIALALALAVASSVTMARGGTISLFATGTDASNAPVDTTQIANATDLHYATGVNPSTTPGSVSPGSNAAQTVNPISSTWKKDYSHGDTSTPANWVTLAAPGGDRDQSGTPDTSGTYFFRTVFDLSLMDTTKPLLLTVTWASSGLTTDTISLDGSVGQAKGTSDPTVLAINNFSSGSYAFKPGLNWLDFEVTAPATNINLETFTATGNAALLVVSSTVSGTLFSEESLGAPEPMSIGLLGLGAASLLTRRRR